MAELGVADMCEPEVEDDIQERDINMSTWDAIIDHPLWQNPSSSSSSSEDERSEDDIQEDLSTKLGNWVNIYSIKHNAVDSLLKILRTLPGLQHEHLPATARTLLKTDRDIEVRQVSGMDYTYLGLKEGLQKNFAKYSAEVRDATEELVLSLNIDGVPIFKSSNTSFWPILCAIQLKPVTVFPVAITCGLHKPSNHDYMLEMVNDMNHIMTNGFDYSGRNYPVKLSCIVCDAPAKAMVKGTKQYSGYYGCDRCDQYGDHSQQRQIFPQVNNLTLRTDDTFRQKSQPGHHKPGQDSPLLNLQIDMVRCFPVDYMHCVCLGVMKKLLNLWIKGPNHLTTQQRQLVNERLLELKVSIPNDFARKPRSLDELSHWKATEFRQFLLYTGKFVVAGILEDQKYEHFLYLSVAIHILLSPSLITNHVVYAGRMLEHFVNQGRNIYGEKFLIYNVHSLLHLKDDAERFNGLENCSGFPFENHLQLIKKLVRSGKRPLVQVVKRIKEMDGTVSVRPMVTPESSIRLVFPDNAYVLADNITCADILEVTNERAEDGSVLYRCSVYRIPQPMFVRPCDSRIVGIYKFPNAIEMEVVRLIPATQLKRKALKVILGTSFTYSAISHLQDE